MLPMGLPTPFRSVLFLLLVSLLTSVTPINASSCSSVVPAGAANRLIVTGDLLYLGSAAAGPFLSRDQGDRWISLKAGLREAGVPTLFGGFTGAHPTQSQKVFFGVQGRLYSSNDSGTSWLRVDGLVGEIDIKAMAFDPLDSETYYVGGYTGLYKTQDDGKTFESLNQQLVDESGSPIRIETLHFSGNSKLIVGSFGQSAHYSTDGGASWVSLKTVLETANQGLLVDTSQVMSGFLGEDHLFVAGHSGLFKSSDGGNSWQSLSLALQQAEPGLVVYRAAQSPTSGALVVFGYVFDLDNSRVSKVLTSQDGGDSWSHVGTSLSKVLVEQAWFLNDQVLVAASSGGFHRSLNQGDTWSSPSKGYSAGLLEQLLPGPGNTIYGRDLLAGLYKSTDSGDSWTLQEQGLTSRTLSTFAISASDPNTIYSSDGVQLSKSTDGGDTWIANIANNSTLAGPQGRPAIFELAVSPTTSDTLLLANVADNAPGIFRSENGGVDWTNVFQTTPSGMSVYGLDVKFDPQAPSFAYAAVMVTDWQTHISGQILRSSDGGRTWQSALENLGRATVSVVGDKTYALAHTGWNQPGGIWQSEDHGQSWTDISLGILNPGTLHPFIGVASDPSTPETLRVFNRTGGTVYVRPKGASRWFAEARRLTEGLVFSMTVTERAGSTEILLGAEGELCRLGNTVVFANGFETGDLAGWSSSSH